MICHISLFELKDKCKLSGVQKLTLLLEETGQCPLIRKSVVETNITYLPLGVRAESPVFGDVIQMIEFDDLEAAMAYPQSLEHQKLLEQSKSMIKRVTAIEYDSAYIGG